VLGGMKFIGIFYAAKKTVQIKLLLISEKSSFSSFFAKFQSNHCHFSRDNTLFANVFFCS